MRRIAVIDSTSLISLTHLELAASLTLFFDIVYVPSAVQREVNTKHRFRYRLRKLYRTGAFQRCATADPTRIELLRIELDEGEAEALVQAQEKNAAYFIGDDKRAREIGEGQGLTAVGTVRLLARLSLEPGGEDASKLVKKLRKELKFRVSEAVVEEAISMASEPIRSSAGGSLFWISSLGISDST